MTERLAAQQNILQHLNERAAQQVWHPQPPMHEDDFGWFHPFGMVEDAALGLKEFGVLPYAGGWLDQPATLRRDMFQYMRMLSREIYVEAEVKRLEDEARARTPKNPPPGWND